MSCPPADVLVRLCKALDVTSDFLLGISDSYSSSAAATDYICLMGSDGTRHVYNIPKDKKRQSLGGFESRISGDYNRRIKTEQRLKLQI